MTCPTIDSLDGEPLAESVTAHVGTCMSCRLVMELLRERKRAEHARDRRGECARFELLIAARAGGTITQPAALLLDTHLRECADCAAAVVPDRRERP